MYTQTCVHTLTRTYISHTYVRTHAHVHTRTYHTHIRIHTYAHCRTRTYTHTHAYTAGVVTGQTEDRGPETQKVTDPERQRDRGPELETETEAWRDGGVEVERQRDGDAGGSRSPHPSGS